MRLRINLLGEPYNYSSTSLYKGEKQRKITKSKIFKNKRPKKRYRPGFASKIIFKPISKMPSAWADKILSAVTKPYIPKTFKQRGSLIYEFTHYYPTDTKETWALWFDFLWRRGAGSRKLPIIQERGDETGKGLQRFISTFGDSGLIEKVKDTDYPKKIIYKVMNPSKMTFPSLFHRGTVYFVPLRSMGTIIHWKVEVEPMAGSKMIVTLLTRGVISTYLKKLAKHIQKIKSTPSGQKPTAIVSGNL